MNLPSGESAGSVVSPESDGEPDEGGRGRGGFRPVEPPGCSGRCEEDREGDQRHCGQARRFGTSGRRGGFQQAGLGLFLEFLKCDLRVGDALEAAIRIFAQAAIDDLFPDSRGVSGAISRTGDGSLCRMAASVDIFVSPEKAGRPVAISYSTEPKLKMSLRASTFRPSACSGDM